MWRQKFAAADGKSQQSHSVWASLYIADAVYELYKIMAKKVTFLGFRGGDRPSPRSARVVNGYCTKCFYPASACALWFNRANITAVVFLFTPILSPLNKSGGSNLAGGTKSLPQFLTSFPILVMYLFGVKWVKKSSGSGNPDIVTSLWLDNKKRKHLWWHFSTLFQTLI